MSQITIPTITLPGEGSTGWGTTYNTAINNIRNYLNTIEYLSDSDLTDINTALDELETHSHNRISNRGTLLIEPGEETDDNKAFNRVLVTDSSGNGAWINGEVKKSAFNKDFGTDSSEVARGNHGHSDLSSAISALQSIVSTLQSAIGALTSNLDVITVSANIYNVVGGLRIVCNTAPTTFVLQWTVNIKKAGSTIFESNFGENNILISESIISGLSNGDNLSITVTASNGTQSKSSSAISHTYSKINSSFENDVIDIKNTLDTVLTAEAVAEKLEILDSFINNVANKLQYSDTLALKMKTLESIPES